MKKFILLFFAVTLCGASAFAQAVVGGASKIGGVSKVGGGPSGALTPVTLVQHNAGSLCFAGSTTCTGSAFGSNTGAGNTLIACAQWQQSSGSTNTLSSVSGQGSFVVKASTLVNFGASGHGSNIGSECAVASSITGGATTAETCTVANAAPALSCIVYEVTPATGAVLAAVATGSTGGSTSGTVAVSAGSATSTENGAFGLTVFTMDDGFGSGFFGTPGSGWTSDQSLGAGNFEYGSEYQAQSVAGSITGNGTTIFTLSPNSWTASMIVLQP